MPSVLYLHGFLSSPQSQKAQLTRKWLQQVHPTWQYFCPQLSSYPHLAKQELIEFYSNLDETPYVIGSSLGGFWATWCVERYGGKAVLVNPAVSPHVRFEHYLNQPLNSYYSDEVVTLTERDAKVLEACDIADHKDPRAYLLMVQTGDETLDYTMALERYKASELVVEQGGNHSFEGFENHLERILDFFAGDTA